MLVNKLQAMQDDSGQNDAFYKMKEQDEREEIEAHKGVRNPREGQWRYMIENKRDKELRHAERKVNEWKALQQERLENDAGGGIGSADPDAPAATDDAGPGVPEPSESDEAEAGGQEDEVEGSGPTKAAIKLQQEIEEHLKEAERWHLRFAVLDGCMLYDYGCAYQRGIPARWA